MGRSSGACSPRRAFKRRDGLYRRIHARSAPAGNGEFWGITSPFRPPPDGGSLPATHIPLRCPIYRSTARNRALAAYLPATSAGISHNASARFSRKAMRRLDWAPILEVFAGLPLRIACRPTRPTHFDGGCRVGRTAKRAGAAEGREPAGAKVPKRRRFLLFLGLYGPAAQVIHRPAYPKTHRSGSDSKILLRFKIQGP